MTTLAYAVAGVLGLGGLALGIDGVLGRAWTVEMGWLVPLGGLRLTMDPLAGFFLAVVAGIAVPVSLYAVGYDRSQRRGLLAYNVFVASMCVVPLAANALTFLLAWELMALASYVLVLRGRDAGAMGAAWVYAVMTHAGLGCLLAGMLVLGAGTGSLDFADWPARVTALSPAMRTLAFGLLAAGFASKAGVIPLHLWLPLAHPAAPSHVSALMSGVMIKLGVYGLMRAGMDWLGTGPATWGVVVLLAGTVSAVLGVLYAIVEQDLKRLLAYSSIENVGIILIGLGATLVFRAEGAHDLAVLGLAAALYHTMNHAAFKALLFLGAGAVLHETGTRNMEELGGLIKRMPWTAACFLLGSVAVAGLPPLNGFVSEWLTFQTLLQNVRVPRPDLNLAFALALAGLALTAGLAAACFVKAFGITFLALPRSEAATRAHEVPTSMRAAMVTLALGCVGFGLAATFVVPTLTAVAGSVLETVAAPSAVGAWFTLEVADGFASLSTPAVALALAAGFLVAVLLPRALGAKGSVRLYETWGCGRMLQTARMQYTATAFSNPFKRVFDFLYRPVKQLDIEVHPDSRFFVRRIAYGNPTRSIFEEWLYQPLLDALRAVSAHTRLLQSGSANLYLVYILVALVAMLVLG